MQHHHFPVKVKDSKDEGIIKGNCQLLFKREHCPSCSPLAKNQYSQKFADTPGSLEGNTEGPGTASSEPLLPLLFSM